MRRGGMGRGGMRRGGMRRGGMRRGGMGRGGMGRGGMGRGRIGRGRMGVESCVPDGGGGCGALSGRMSPCMMPCLCRCSRPSTRWRKCDQTVRSGSAIGRPNVSRGCELPPSTCSSTTKIWSHAALEMTSKHWTQLGCSICVRWAISACTVEAPSRVVSADLRSTLSEYSRPSRVTSRWCPNAHAPPPKDRTTW
jgi:hypothetical protein